VTSDSNAVLPTHDPQSLPDTNLKIFLYTTDLSQTSLLAILNGRMYANVEGKVVMKAYLLFEHYAMNTYWGAEVELHVFLTSALDGGE